MKQPKNAASEYERLRQLLDVLLVEIRDGLDQHRPTNPKSLQWGHVGDLQHYHARLRELADQLHHRGEFAKEPS